MLGVQRDWQTTVDTIDDETGEVVFTIEKD